MPITFTVDHAKQRVVVIATGAVTRQTVLSYFDTQRRLDGLTYPRLVECRKLEPQLTDEDWRDVATWLRQATQHIAFGPAAVVVDHDQTFALVEMISALVSDLCELRPFGDRESAEEWLSAQCLKGAPES
jgi:hypothetical protein